MIGLMYIQPSKQSEMDEVFQKWNILVYWLDDWLDVYPTAIRGINCHETSISFLFNVPFRKCHILIVVLVTKSNISLDEFRL